MRTATEGGPIGSDGAVGDPYRFVSTRLVRDLIAADVQSERVDGDSINRTTRLLTVVARGLSPGAVALLNPTEQRVTAALGFEQEEAALLGADPPRGGRTLVERAVQERRVLLLATGSKEPLLSALREIRGSWTALSLVPLFERGPCVGILVLAWTTAVPTAASLRSLAPAFRLFGMLLRAASWPDPRREPSSAPTGENESYLVTIDELRTQLDEASDQRRELEERVATARATQRAEVESLRARVVELETALVAGGAERGQREALEVEARRLVGRIDESDRCIARLEAENRSLLERLESSEGSPSFAVPGGPGEEGTLRLVRADPDGEPADTASAPLAMLEDEELRLSEIAAAAAAAIGDSPGDVDTKPSTDGSEPFGPGVESDSSQGEAAAVQNSGQPGLSLWQLDGEASEQSWAGELAAHARAELWTGEGEPPRATKAVAALNLLDPSGGRALEWIASGREVAGVVYGLHHETNRGFEVGLVAWLARPLDSSTALGRIRDQVGGRLSGIVLVSSCLRELADFRRTLADADVAGSVACDSRQAIDLLEIVGTPDLILIDLALEGGQGLALARDLRRSPETSDLPLVFLLPELLDFDAFRAAIERGLDLESYGSEDARRLVNGALATFR